MYWMKNVLSLIDPSVVLDRSKLLTCGFYAADVVVVMWI